MRNTISEIGKVLGDAVETARDQLPEISLVSDVEVPIYVIHHGPGAEDYELLCDFEQFMKASQSGLLNRPLLRVWAGRQDFERYLFARHLREAFSQQFETVRQMHQAEKEAQEKAWSLPSAGDVLLWGLNIAGGLVGSLLLYIATETGRTAIERISKIIKRSVIGRALGSSSAEAELEELIEEKKAVIDSALSRIEIVLHCELYAYAWRGQPPGPMTGMDREAWPLPSFVRERMET